MRAPSANDDALAGVQPAQGIEGDAKAEQRDCAAAPAVADKEVATATAEAARLGCALYPLARGWLLVRAGWGVCRELQSLSDVRRVLAAMGGGAR